MEIDYLREFVVLAETGNFLEAADRLFISQSSLSRHIKAIEEDLGALLFDRTTRKVGLNQFGKMLLPYAKEITRIQYDYTTAFFNELKEAHGSITVGSIPSMAQYNITDVLARFQRENSTFSLNVVEADSLQLTEMLRMGQCDFAFIRESDDSGNEFNKLPFTVDNLAAILPATHHLARKDVVHLSELSADPLLLIGKDTFMYSLCVGECRKAGFEPKVAFTGHRAENILDLVSKGMGVALLMKKPAIYLSNPNIAIVDVAPRITTTISLAYVRSQKISVAATHFLNLVKTI